MKTLRGKHEGVSAVAVKDKGGANERKGRMTNGRISR